MVKPEKFGTLYIVATPIGNLEDITIRAIKTLRIADAIAAEDTRHTVKLLNRYKIKNHLISYHAHSADSREKELLVMLTEGKNIALVTDAGTPVISDPGARLINACISAGVDVLCVPGPSAAIAAVCVSGIDCSSFIFAGFLPLKGALRNTRLKSLADCNAACIIYESPERLLKTLADIRRVWGDNIPVCVARELTKLHEEAVRGTALSVYEEFLSRDTIRGEFVLVIAAKIKPEVEMDEDIERIALNMLESGQSARDTANALSSQFGISKNRAYKFTLRVSGAVRGNP